MEKWYSDFDNLAITLREAISTTRSGRVEVVQADVVVDGLTLEEVRRRNIIDRLNNICVISWDQYEHPTMFAGLKISFHENSVENSFTFSGTPGGWSRLGELSNQLSKVEGILLGEMDASRPWFAELDTASMAAHTSDGGADREFTYETAIPMRG